MAFKSVSRENVFIVIMAVTHSQYCAIKHKREAQEACTIHFRFERTHTTFKNANKTESHCREVPKKKNTKWYIPTKTVQFNPFTCSAMCVCVV